MEILNRKARYNYFIDKEIECGISLAGTEVKSIRKGSVDISDSFVLIKNQEAEIINMYIAPYENGNRYNKNERRTRKLLLHKEEIKKLESKIKEKNYTLVPLKVYFKNNKVKVLVGLARGKKLYDKRETIKQRDLERLNK